MTTLSERHLKTGGDPRTFAEYAALRNEMNKLTHPARPDVNWRQAENLCLSLFEHNGVDLQTAAWYILARTHLAGLSGLNEGLTIVAALVARQWRNLWPQPVPARKEILSTLSKRLQQILRSRPLTSAELGQLNQAEEHLNEILQRQELTSVGQIDTLRTHIHLAVVRLENSNTGHDQALSAPTDVLSSVSAIPGEATEYVKRVYVPESLSEIPSPAKPWKSFAAGMMTMLVLAGTLTWGGLALRQPDPAQEHVAATLSPLPTLSSASRPPQSPESVIRQTQQLLQLKPDWALACGDSLVRQALRMWPERGKRLAQQWQQQKAAITLTPENLTGWHQGVAQLEQLANRLNALDEQKGKYMTVSELKSAVFAIMQSLNRTVPVEEQLRQLSVTPVEQGINAVRQRQVEQHLQQLIASYAALKQSPAE